MRSLSENPVLGHLTTFGGHPVSCAAGLAAMNVLLNTKWIEQVKEKEALFLKTLIHPSIKSVRSAGLWMAIEFNDFDECKKIIDKILIEGLVSDWFLFAPNCLRIAPPLMISELEINKVCSIILAALNH